MRRIASDSVAGSSAAVFALFGVVCLAFGLLVLGLPDSMYTIVGYGTPNPDGLVEFTVVYGGFYAGMGLFYLLATQNPALHPGAAAWLAISATCAALGRVGGIVLYELFTVEALALLTSELIMTTAGWAAWMSESRKER